MTHDATIPHDLHTELRPAVTDALGSFWSSVFGDRDLLDALIASRTLSASQAYVDAMEALGLRDHRTLPVYHREHWHPLFIRLSDRNEGRGLVLGMDSAVIGGQRDRGGSPTPYKVGEVFKVGANAELSKVYTYPFEAMTGCPLVRVRTGIFDSISNPRHVLVQGRDFALGSGVLTIRKEEDPFEVGGYRVLEVEDDRVAVLWVCDGEYDTNNVGDFLAYPMGFDAESSEVTKRILSAYWDAVLYGLAPQYLNSVLGALYDVPTAEADETVEHVTEVDGTWTDVVTPTRVYHVETAHRLQSVKAGAALRTGDFLTDELTVYHSLSEDEFNGLVDIGAITKVTLPHGSVYGVEEGEKNVSYDAEVEYLESTGVQLVNLPWKYDTGMSVYLKYARMPSTLVSGGVLSSTITRPAFSFPAQNGTSSQDRVILRHIDSSTDQYATFSISIPGDPVELVLDAVGDRVLVNGSVIRAGMLAALGDAAPFESASTLSLFGSGGSFPSAARVYRVYADDKEGRRVFDLVPVRVGNVGYFLDRISGRLFGDSKGASPLLVGPDVSVTGDGITITSRASGMEDGGWFRFNDGDSASSMFWQRVMSNVPRGELERMFYRLCGAEYVTRADGTRTYDKEVEYIEADGSQYIDMDLIPGSDTRIDIDIELFFKERSEEGYNYIRPLIVGPVASKRFHLMLTSPKPTSGLVVIETGFYTYHSFNYPYTGDGRHVFRLDKTGAYLDGVLKKVFEEQPQFSTGAHLRILGGPESRTGTTLYYPASGRIYAVRVYENGRIVRDCTPVVKDGVGYLYDSVSERLFGNAGSGSFAIGPDVHTIDPLKTVGYAALANTVIVSTGGRRLAGTPLAPQVFRAIQRLMPGYASLLTVDEVTGA